MSEQNLPKSFFSLTNELGHPNTSALLEQLRDLPALRWNSKVFGHQLAAQYYGDSRVAKQAVFYDDFRLGWKATKFVDFQQAWFVDACEQLKVAPLLHRKLWEDAFILKSLEVTGKLRPGVRGIGFGCGEEPFPSYFASKGVRVLATDLDPNSIAAAGWIATNQHANLTKAFKPQLIEKEKFDELVSFEYADMNSIPERWSGQFDFCWSVCAFEHLGSIEAGLKFVENSAKLLKPGGIAIHTTEFNYSKAEETIDNWGTVLFRRKDFEELAGRLRTSGFIVPEVSFEVGSTPVDWFIDVPPYPGNSDYFDSELKSLHLKLMVDGFPSTCFGLVVQRSLS